jgi:hypothetical protein
MPPAWRGEAVHRAEARVGEAEAAAQAGEGEVGARLGVERAARGARERPRRARDPVARQRVGDRLARAETKGSITCESASRPLAAITEGGAPIERSGSTIASRGSISGLRSSPSLRVGHAQHGVARDLAPVPAVVGIATNGSDGS